MSGMKDFSRERTIPCQSRELCRDPPRWAGPRPYEKLGVTGTTAAVNTYQILRSHKRIVGKPEDKARLVNVLVDGKIILKILLQIFKLDIPVVLNIS
jgi:hypothetical protein